MSLTDVSQIRVALKFLATRGAENNPKRPNSMSAFLNQHILGLVTRIVEAVNGTRDDQMISEREKSIKAMEELVKLAKTDARAARPQVRVPCFNLRYLLNSLALCLSSNGVLSN